MDSLDLVALLREGIAQTYPTKRTLHDDAGTHACATGCIKLALTRGKTDADSPRWARVREHLAKTRIDWDRLPAQKAEVPEDSVLKHEARSDPSRASLMLVLTTLNDYTSMSRDAIAEWMASELDDIERTVYFGADREEKQQHVVL